MDAPIRGEILAFEGFRFDPRARQVLRQDPTGAWVPVPTGSRALEILAVLLNNAGMIVSKDAIMTAVWPGVAVEPSNLTVHMAALRRVLEGCRLGRQHIRRDAGPDRKSVV